MVQWHSEVTCEEFIPVAEKQFLSPLLATTEYASEIYFTGYTLRRVRIALLTTERKYCINPHVATLRVLRKPLFPALYERSFRTAKVHTRSSTKENTLLANVPTLSAIAAIDIIRRSC